MDAVVRGKHGGADRAQEDLPGRAITVVSLRIQGRHEL
jgi:hypothetical protein